MVGPWQAYAFKMLHDQDFLDGFSGIRYKFDFSQNHHHHNYPTTKTTPPPYHHQN